MQKPVRFRIIKKECDKKIERERAAKTIMV